MNAVCVVCGKEFEKKSNNVKTCGAECGKENTRQYMRRFSASPGRIEIERERGRRRSADNPIVTDVCMICGKEFRKIRSSRTCGPECREIKRHPPLKSWPVVPPFPDDIDRVAFGHWLSGFADGEATFQLVMATQKNRPFPNFKAFIRITLRDDDIGILRMIQSYWNCGRISLSDNVRSKVPNAKPVAYYEVSCVSDLIDTVIPHLDYHPMRAKKRGDFLVWRKGVELMAAVQKRPLKYREGHCRNRHGGTYPKWTQAESDQFASLSEELKSQRQYGSVVPPEVVINGHGRDAQEIL